VDEVVVASVMRGEGIYFERIMYLSGEERRGMEWGSVSEWLSEWLDG